MTDVGFPNRAAIESEQLRQLRALLRALVPHNRFYAQRLAQAGISPEVRSLRAFSERMPFTDKRELAQDQLDHPPYGTNLTFPLAQYTRFNQTSGTTGSPMRWLDTPESWNWMLDNWRQVFKNAGVTAEDRVLFAF